MTFGNIPQILNVVLCYEAPNYNISHLLIGSGKHGLNNIRYITDGNLVVLRHELGKLSV